MIRELTSNEIDYVAGGLANPSAGITIPISDSDGGGTLTINSDGSETITVNGHYTPVTDSGIDWMSVGTDLGLGATVALAFLSPEVTVPMMIAITGAAIGAQIINWQSNKNGHLTNPP